jgi:excisionase family DNA binding protein
MSEFVTASEASEILGCSEALIRKRIRKQELAATKDRGQWRILRADLDQQPRPHETIAPQNRTVGSDRTAEPHGDTVEPDRTAVEPDRRTGPHEWRDDLLAQVARLEADVAQRDADKDATRADFDTRLAEQRQEAGLRVEASKARVIDLERELTMRDSRFADLQAKQDTEVSDLRGQVAALEAKVRSTLEERAEENGQLANRIADLVTAHTEMQTRVYELEPVASQVPMLQAAVEEKDASLSEREHELSQVRDDIDAIASRPVTGPVFRLLTKGKLRR